MNRDTAPPAAVDESDDDTDGFLLDGFETIPGLLPFVERSQRRRRARRRRWLATWLALAATAGLAAYLAS